MLKFPFHSFILSLAAPFCDFSGSILPGLVGKASSAALDWATALLEELRKSFSANTSRALAQLLAVMLSARVLPLLSKSTIEVVGKKMGMLARLVPVDGSSPAALMQLIVTEVGGSQLDDVKSALATLQLKTT